MAIQVPSKKRILDAIVRSLQLSFVSRSCLYMKEFMLGLSTYGLDQMITQNPRVCQPLFVAEDLKKGVTHNADYLYSLFEPHYSREGTSRRCFEEDIIISFQDILNDCETGNLVGHQAPIACNHKEEQGDKAMNQDQSFVFESLVYQGSWAG